MDLLIFAHRGEAKAFIDFYQLKSSPDFFLNGLYEGLNQYVLITGEGTHNATSKTSAALGFLHKKISRVFNIGVCGHLDLKSSKFDLQDIVEVRTCYAHMGKPIFQSITNNSQSEVDIVTVNERVIDAKKKEQYYPIAPLVDREAWAVSHCAKFLFKQDTYVIKLISDNISAAPQSTQTICEYVKDNAPLYSAKLLEYYQEHYAKSQVLSKAASLNKKPLWTEGLYFTVAQSNLFFSLLGKLQTQYSELELIEKIATHELFTEKDSPKVKTKKLINKLQEILNPRIYFMQQNLEQICKTHSQENLNFQYDKNLENPGVQVSFSYENTSQLEEYWKTLETFPISQVSNLFQGKFIDNLNFNNNFLKEDKP